jgi:hypothetical protein
MTIVELNAKLVVLKAAAKLVDMSVMTDAEVVVIKHAIHLAILMVVQGRVVPVVTVDALEELNNKFTFHVQQTIIKFNR